MHAHGEDFRSEVEKEGAGEDGAAVEFIFIYPVKYLY